MAAWKSAINAICMALLVVAESEGTSVHAKRMETAVGVFEVLLLWGERKRGRCTYGQLRMGLLSCQSQATAIVSAWSTRMTTTQRCIERPVLIVRL